MAGLFGGVIDDDLTGGIAGGVSSQLGGASASTIGNNIGSWWNKTTGKTGAKDAQNQYFDTYAPQQAAQAGVEQKVQGQEGSYLEQQKALQGTYQGQRNAAQGTYQGAKQAENQQADTTRGGLVGEQGNILNADTQNYQGISDRYVADQQSLKGQAANQATNAQATYSNNIQPGFKNLMERAQNNAGMAMSLDEARNPNNSVASSVRGLYGQQSDAALGQNAALQSQYGPNYNQIIGGTRAQGLADYGVLAALGAQATEGQMGAQLPTTGAQLQLMQANNNRAASGAVNAAEQRIQSLQDQQRAQQQALANRQMDTAGSYRSQGLQAGFDQTAQAYSQGQQAQGLAAQMGQAYQGAENANLNAQAGLRGEQAGYGQNIAGSQQGAANRSVQNQMQNLEARANLAEGQIARGYGDISENYQMGLGNAGQDYQMGSGLAGQQLQIGENQAIRANQAISDQYGAQRAQSAADLATINAQRQQNSAIFGGLLGAGGMIGGGLAGGPIGAMAGGALGQAGGQAAGGGTPYGGGMGGGGGGGGGGYAGGYGSPQAASYFADDPYADQRRRGVAGQLGGVGQGGSQVGTGFSDFRTAS